MTRSVWNGGVNSTSWGGITRPPGGSSGCCYVLAVVAAFAATGLGVLSRLT
jgi:hypothetical protein